MSHVARLLAERFAAWGEVPRVVGEVFGQTDPATVAEALERFCQCKLCAGIDRAEFFEASVGSVHGLRLLDGRRVVVKLHGPQAKPSFLTAAQQVQRRVSTEGFPAPEPLVLPPASVQVPLLPRRCWTAAGPPTRTTPWCGSSWPPSRRVLSAAADRLGGAGGA